MGHIWLHTPDCKAKKGNKQLSLQVGWSVCEAFVLRAPGGAARPPARPPCQHPPGSGKLPAFCSNMGDTPLPLPQRFTIRVNMHSMPVHNSCTRVELSDMVQVKVGSVRASNGDSHQHCGILPSLQCNRCQCNRCQMFSSPPRYVSCFP